MFVYMYSVRMCETIVHIIICECYNFYILNENIILLYAPLTDVDRPASRRRYNNKCAKGNFRECHITTAATRRARGVD